MSSSINVYAVSLERLRQVVGSGDQDLIDAILKERGDFLASIDDIDDEAELTCADAVAELINGGPSEDAPGYLYGYAVEAICSHLGEALPDINPIAVASDHIERVDAALGRTAIPVRFHGLVYGGSPVAIPEPDDYPFIGLWTAAEVAAAKAAFASADLTAVDPAVGETLRQMRRWVELAAESRGVAVVGFLS